MNDKKTHQHAAALRFTEQQMEMLLTIKDMVRDEVEHLLRDEIEKLTTSNRK